MPGGFDGSLPYCFAPSAFKLDVVITCLALVDFQGVGDGWLFGGAAFVVFVDEVTAVCQVGEDDAGVCQVEEVGGAFAGALVTAVYACEDAYLGSWLAFAVGEVEGVFDVEEGAAGHGAVDAGAGVVGHGFIVVECSDGVN